MTMTTIILAAGLSSRMKQFKPLALYEQKTFLENIIRKSGKISKEIIVVTGFKNELVQNEINRISKFQQSSIKTIFNENYRNGMFLSIKKGISEVQTVWVLLHFVDQPSLPQDFYFEIKSKASEKFDWIQPKFNGQNGHPILINKRIYPLILNSDDNLTLKNVSEQIKLKFIYPTIYSEVLDNFNDEKFNSKLQDE